MKKIISSLIFVLLITAAGYLAYIQFFKTTEGFVPYESQKLQNRPTSIDSTNRAFVEKRMADIQKVISEFKPETPKIDQINYYFALSADQQMLGQGLEAKKSLEMALALKYDAHIIHAYGVLLYDLGAGEDALKYIDMAIDSAPDVPNFWQTKISIAQELYKNNSARVESVYIDGLKATKDDIDLLTLYASYLTKVGKKDEAVLYWQKARDKNPSAQSIYDAEIKNLQ